MKFKTILMGAAMLCAALPATAQDAQPVENPNRAIMIEKSGQYKAYMIDRVDKMQFAKVDGPCTAAIDIKGYDDAKGELTLAITRQEGCEAFKLAVLPAVQLATITDDAGVIGYVNARGAASEPYYQDFDNATLSGVNFEADTEYTVVTIGMDKYNTEAGVSRANFTTPAVPIVGEPKVECEFSDITKTSFMCHFTPNNDVKTYYFVSGEKGTMQAQYEMFAPMFGFSNFGEMIKMWGVAKDVAEDYEYKNMTSNTEYEVFVQSLDVNDNMAPYQVFEVSTLPAGGEGASVVDITTGQYINRTQTVDGADVTKPYLDINFVPNDQTWRYRLNVVLASYYDNDVDGYNNELRQEPPQPNMLGWWEYENVSDAWQIDPNTEVVILAAGQNANGEWGEINAFRYTTPAAVQGMPAQRTGMAAAKANRGIIPTPRTAKAANQPGTVRLTPRLQLTAK